MFAPSTYTWCGHGSPIWEVKIFSATLQVCGIVDLQDHLGVITIVDGITGIVKESSIWMGETGLFGCCHCRLFSLIILLPIGAVIMVKFIIFIIRIRRFMKKEKKAYEELKRKWETDETKEAKINGP
ncbi:MAG: hypothetical protein QXJ27_05045 [Thermoplasmata archaeon]